MGSFQVLIKNGIAYGVELFKNGKRFEVYARKEVVLSAGVIGSPHILLHSGVGPRPHLESLKVSPYYSMFCF